MSDTVFYNKVKTLLDQLDILLHQEWDETLEHLDKSNVRKFIDEGGTFLEPEGESSQERWSRRDQFLNAYHGVVVAMMRLERGKTASQFVQPQVSSVEKNTSAPISVFPAAPLRVEKPEVAAPIRVKDESVDLSKTTVGESAVGDLASSSPVPSAKLTEAVRAEPVDEGSGMAESVKREAEDLEAKNQAELAASDDRQTSEQALDKKEEKADPAPYDPKVPTAPLSMPKMPSMQMPRPITGPQGFPSAFSSSASRTPIPPSGKSQPGSESSGETSKLEASTGKVVFTTDAKAEEEAKIREKFDYLLKGVKQEKIRDFILADGVNTKTGKPTMVVYIPAGIWLEFAFDFEEGKRILDKYPQRDPELIEFMKASGHSS